MKGNPDIIKILNDVLRKELTAINHYFIHAKMCRNWGYQVLAEHARALRFAHHLCDRLLFLMPQPQ